MRHELINSGKRKAVNISLDTGVIDAAREVGINLSQVSEVAIRVAAQKERDRRWKDDNREWIAAHNRWVEVNGLPLERYRLF